MSRSVTVPDDIYERAAKMAAERCIALEDFVSSALVDQMAGRDYLARRGARSSEETFRQALDMIPTSNRRISTGSTGLREICHYARDRKQWQKDLTVDQIVASLMPKNAG